MSIINNGVTQWKFQRFANVVCIVAIVALVYMLFCDSITSHAELKAIFEPMWIKLGFTFALLIAVLNSILAGWQIAHDYAQKINMPASIFVVFTALVSVGYLLFGVKILFT